MKRFMHGLLAAALSAPAWAIDETPRSNTTTATWEIYGAVALVFVIAFGYVYWHQKREEEREKRRKDPPSNPV